MNIQLFTADVFFHDSCPEDPILTPGPTHSSTKMQTTYLLTLAVLALALQCTVALKDDDCEGE